MSLLIFFNYQVETGTIAATLQPLTAALTGVMHPEGAATASIQPLTSALAGTQTQSGAIASSTQPLTAAAFGVMQPSGAVASSIQPLTSALVGVMQPTGTITVTLTALMAAITAESRTFVDLGAGQGAGGAIKGLRPGGGATIAPRIIPGRASSAVRPGAGSARGVVQ